MPPSFRLNSGWLQRAQRESGGSGAGIEMSCGRSVRGFGVGVVASDFVGVSRSRSPV